MDRVSKPTNYEPPRFRTCPQGTRVAVHYSATTICPFSMHLSSYLQSVQLRCPGRSGLPSGLTLAVHYFFCLGKRRSRGGKHPPPQMGKGGRPNLAQASLSCAALGRDPQVPRVM